MMKALVYLFIFFAPFSFVKASILQDSSALADSTTLVKNQPDSITRKVVALLVDARELSLEKPLEAVKSYRSALITNKVKDEIWEADIRLEMGKLLAEVKNKEALPQLLKANALYKKKANLQGRANALTEISKLYESSGQFTLALNNYNELYKILNKLGESVLAGNVASHLTDVFIKKQKYVEAFHYADLAKSAYYKVCRKDSLGSIYYKIAHIKKKVNSPKLAEYYILNQALSYYRSSNDMDGRLKSFDFLGHLYQDQKRYSQAKWFYLQANNQSRLSNDTASIVTSLINLGLVKVLIGDLSLAKQDIDEAELIIKGDSSYAPLMKEAKVKHAALFKQLNTVASATKEKSKKNVKAKSPVKAAEKKASGSTKSTSNTILVDTEKKEKEAPIQKKTKGR